MLRPSTANTNVQALASFWQGSVRVVTRIVVRRHRYASWRHGHKCVLRLHTTRKWCQHNSPHAVISKIQRHCYLGIRWPRDVHAHRRCLMATCAPGASVPGGCVTWRSALTRICSMYSGEAAPPCASGHAALSWTARWYANLQAQRRYRIL